MRGKQGKETDDERQIKETVLYYESREGRWVKGACIDTLSNDRTFYKRNTFYEIRETEEN